ncbi:MAG: hypothetical protein FWG22_02465 [Prolixibacteraceae bacterium]|nr:hypothetical protein [Prolixibacteraceae bacterium]
MADNKQFGNMRRLLLVVLMCLVTLSVFSQSALSKWRDYLSYGSARKVVEGGGKIYCVTGGGLFYFDQEDNSLIKMTIKDGLSGVEVQSIAYSEKHKCLIVAYTDANIDLVYENRIVNMTDIKRKNFSGEKVIHNITVSGDDAFLACGFGIVVLNLSRREIKETCIIGDAGTQLAVFDVEPAADRMYAATHNGVLSAALNSNLQDFRNWRIEDLGSRINSKFSFLATFDGNIHAVFTLDQWSGDEVYELKNGNWSRTLNSIGFVKDFQVSASGEYLVAPGQTSVMIFNTKKELIGRIQNYNLNGSNISSILPRSSLIDKNGSVWIADETSGLIRLTGEMFEQNIPVGPYSNNIFSMTFANNTLWTTMGGRTNIWNNQHRRPAFQSCGNEKWTLFSEAAFPEMTGFYDIVQVAVDPTDPEHIVAASWGGGILEFRGNKFVNRYDHSNSPLETALPDQPEDPYTRIGGIVFDNKGTLWVTNAQSSKILHSLSPSGEWASYLLEVSGFNYQVGGIINTRNNDKLIIIPRGNNIMVVNSDLSKQKHLSVASYYSNGSEEVINEMNDVYSIVEDLDGKIWVGTSKGVAVYANSSIIWSDFDYASQPNADANSGFYNPLLANEIITALLVDGANRKWIGTEKSGLYLVSANGDEELLHFTTENSPLYSDNILCLAQNPNTGELFIGTGKGLISYQGDAPQGGNSFSGMYVYPNPVRETYSGPIVIEGLMMNSDVKITDVAGNLVYKTKSTGSRAEWDGKNLKGNRVSTGVYLILAADSKGDKSHVIKLLFIK